jgi:heme/copper-type cytochrome/quinol oxidase subunit 2
MTRDENATSDAVWLAILVVVVAVSLRGYVPGAENPAPERDTEHPAATAMVIGLLVVSIAIVATAVVARMRNRSVPTAGGFDMPSRSRGETARPTWRMVVIAFCAVVLWLLFVMVLNRFAATPPQNPPQVSAPGSTPVATPDHGNAVPPRTEEPAGDSDLMQYFYVATVAFLVILVAGTLVAARRRHRLVQAAPLAEVRLDDEASDIASESLARAAEVGLAEVGDLSREPRKAIIACYAAMEGELSRVPGAMPEDFDTASEVLDRAVAHHALGPDSATQLVDLFDEARFSPHVMTEAHRDVAVRVLQRVLGELRSSV